MKGKRHPGITCEAPGFVDAANGQLTYGGTIADTFGALLLDNRSQEIPVHHLLEVSNSRTWERLVHHS